MAPSRPRPSSTLVRQISSRRKISAAIRTYKRHAGQSSLMPVVDPLQSMVLAWRSSSAELITICFALSPPEAKLSRTGQLGRSLAAQWAVPGPSAPSSTITSVGSGSWATRPLRSSLQMARFTTLAASGPPFFSGSAGLQLSAPSQHWSSMHTALHEAAWGDGSGAIEATMTLSALTSTF